MPLKPQLVFSFPFCGFLFDFVCLFLLFSLAFKYLSILRLTLWRQTFCTFYAYNSHKNECMWAHQQGWKSVAIFCFESLAKCNISVMQIVLFCWCLKGIIALMHECKYECKCRCNQKYKVHNMKLLNENENEMQKDLKTKTLNSRQFSNVFL